MSLEVLEPGFHTLVVDSGRRGVRSLGLPEGGAADRAALGVANGLVGNPPHAAALEITMVGPTLRANCRLGCALFGAPFGMAIANKGRLVAGMSFTLEPGDVIKISGTPHGCRGYLAVRRGIQGRTLFGSRSGFEPLTAGTVLPCHESTVPRRALAFDSLPRKQSGEAALLRVLPGPQFKNFFDPDQLFAGIYQVSPACNRMGLRLHGQALERRAGELPSEAVAPGTIQVTNDGMPVILGVDGQTIGGYPKIAHIIRADLDHIAQLRPGDQVRFVRVTPQEAEIAAAERQRHISEWLCRLSATLRS